MQLLIEKKAIEPLLKGNFEEAAYAAAKVWDIFPGNAGGKNPLSNKPRDLNPTKQYYEKRLEGYHGR